MAIHFPFEGLFDSFTKNNNTHNFLIHGYFATGFSTLTLSPPSKQIHWHFLQQISFLLRHANRIYGYLQLFSLGSREETSLVLAIFFVVRCQSHFRTLCLVMAKSLNHTEKFLHFMADALIHFFYGPTTWFFILLELY